MQSKFICLSYNIDRTRIYYVDIILKWIITEGDPYTYFLETHGSFTYKFPLYKKFQSFKLISYHYRPNRKFPQYYVFSLEKLALDSSAEWICERSVMHHRISSCVYFLAWTTSFLPPNCSTKCSAPSIYTRVEKENKSSFLIFMSNAWGACGIYAFFSRRTPTMLYREQQQQLFKYKRICI